MVRISGIDGLDVLAGMARDALGRGNFGSAVLCLDRYFAVASKSKAPAQGDVAELAVVAYLANAAVWEMFSVEGSQGDYSGIAQSARDAAGEIAAAHGIGGDGFAALEEMAAGMASGRYTALPHSKVTARMPASKPVINPAQGDSAAWTWRRSQVLYNAGRMPYCRW